MNRNKIPLFIKRYSLLTIAMLCLTGCSSKSVSVFEGKLEQALCGNLKEPFAFWGWRRTAGPADARRVQHIKHISSVEFKTEDNRTLRGYAILPDPERFKQPKGYLLIAQGNAMLADMIIGYFNPYATHGYAVYIIDYRGYGRSDGRPRIKAIINDYRMIIGKLDEDYQGRRMFYGLSLGGVILSNALRMDTQRKTFALDSSPATLSDFGCPETIDTINNLPAGGGELLYVYGGQDEIIPRKSLNRLASAVSRIDGRVYFNEDFKHIFRDRSVDLFTQRMEATYEFLTGQKFVYQ